MVALSLQEGHNLLNFMTKKMKTFLILVILFISPNIYANTFWDNNLSATPSVFKVKPNDMKLSGDFSLSTGECTGENIYTITKTMTADNGRCDIAGVEENAIACNYGPTNNMPVGEEYKYLRVELDRTMWLKGTVTNSGSNSELSSCHTDSSNTQSANNIYAEGSVGGTESVQAINFVNGPGNEAFIGNATKTTSNTDESYINACNSDPNSQACSFGYINSLKTQGSVHRGPAASGGNMSSYDYWMITAYIAPSENIWQSDLEEDDTQMVLIYLLSSPYTRASSDIFPTIRMSFDVTDALDADFIKSTEAGKDDVKTCTLYVGSPGVNISVTD